MGSSLKHRFRPSRQQGLEAKDYGYVELAPKRLCARGTGPAGDGRDFHAGELAAPDVVKHQPGNRARA